MGIAPPATPTLAASAAAEGTARHSVPRARDAPAGRERRVRLMQSAALGIPPPWIHLAETLWGRARPRLARSGGLFALRPCGPYWHFWPGGLRAGLATARALPHALRRRGDRNAHRAVHRLATQKLNARFIAGAGILPLRRTWVPALGSTRRPQASEASSGRQTNFGAEGAELLCRPARRTQQLRPSTSLCGIWSALCRRSQIKRKLSCARTRTMRATTMRRPPPRHGSSPPAIRRQGRSSRPCGSRKRWGLRSISWSVRYADCRAPCACLNGLIVCVHACRL